MRLPRLFFTFATSLTLIFATLGCGTDGGAAGAPEDLAKLEAEMNENISHLDLAYGIGIGTYGNVEAADDYPWSTLSADDRAHVRDTLVEQVALADRYLAHAGDPEAAEQVRRARHRAEAYLISMDRFASRG